jgi:hypothetical protein
MPDLKRPLIPFGKRPPSTRPLARSVRVQAAPRRFTVGPAERRRPPRHIPWRRIGVGFGGVAILGSIAYGLSWLLLGNSLRVRDIHVTGTQVADPRQVASVAQVAHKSLLRLDSSDAARRVEGLPEIKGATVSRRWLRGVQIEVVERQAWGYWQAGGMRVVIDEKGNTLERARPPKSDAPTVIEIGGTTDFANHRVSDPDTVQLVSQLYADGTFARLKVRPTGFVFRRDRGLTVLVEGGPDVVFGDSNNYSFKVATWAALVGQLARDARATREIDLRFGQRVVMR